MTAFIRTDCQERYLDLLSNPERRRRFFGSAAKSYDLVPEHIRETADELQDVVHVATSLRSRGAGEQCYVISESAEIDGREMPLDEALRAVVCSGHATFLDCVPGELGYYEATDFEERYVLQRTVA